MVKTELDTRAFDKAFAEYIKFSKKSIPDIINAKLYYIARNATMTTKSSDKTKIKSELMAPARDYPDVPLAAIIVNKELGAKKQKGLTGSLMSKSINDLIRRRQRSINFIRSGWKTAIKQLEDYLRYSGELSFVRRYGSSSKADPQTMRKREPKNSGKAVPAPVTNRSGRTYGEIHNDIGGNGKPSLAEIKAIGLQRAVNMEAASMRLYIERKLNEGAAKFNR